mmetsp:Transcript_23787/g.49280  ORF Transcript_23787/g.49280 Transcript_23787/m.49280 type:complete len:262 (+) Transcript_23787:117-902(+)
MTTTTTLVVGATGATGRHVVLQLLQQKQNVRAIVRSKKRLLNSLDEILPNASSNLHIVTRLDCTEANILDLDEDYLKDLTRGCDAVVSCLGHNMNFKGLFLPPRRLVKSSVERLIHAIEENQKSSFSTKKTKFILMGSDGVANPLGGDDKRSVTQRCALSIIRNLVPPHKDNERAASFIVTKRKEDNPHLEWTVIRPTDLVNDGVGTKYELFAKPQKYLFAGSSECVATRANVARSMVDLVLAEDLWDEWKFKMPVVHNLS